MFSNKKGNMGKPFFMLLFAVISVVSFAQTENKTDYPNANRTIEKKGVKMYELKMDGNSGVVIIDPKSDKKEDQMHNSTLPLPKDTTKSKH
jgi:hypothetical protein